MSRMRFNDPDGYKTCRTCIKLYVLSKENFTLRYDAPCGFSSYCKGCENKRRRESSKSKIYHKINRICKSCMRHFYTSRSIINQGKRKEVDRGNYCSIKCVPRLGYSGPQPLLRGEKCHFHKLTEKQVKEIRKIKSTGATDQYIADQYGVNRSTISYVIRKDTWKDS